MGDVMSAEDRNGLSTKELLLRVLTSVEKLDEKVDKSRESQVRTETILTEGRFNERITSLEKFRDRFDGAMSPVRWALGGSGVALLISVLNALGVIKHA